MAVTSPGHVTDDRLVGGFTWLIETVIGQYRELDERVREDVRLRREREQRERQERHERVRQIRLQRYIQHEY